MRAGIFLLVMGLIIMGCQRDGAMPEAAPATADMKHCRNDGDCILVDISCNGCCQQDAVHRKDSTEYYQHKLRTCVGEPGAVCKCCFFKSKAACVSGQCVSQVLEQNCSQPLE